MRFSLVEVDKEFLTKTKLVAADDDDPDVFFALDTTAAMDAGTADIFCRSYFGLFCSEVCGGCLRDCAGSSDT